MPSAIQDFLRKGEDEGKDVASRIDNLTSGFLRDYSKIEMQKKQQDKD